MESLFQWTVSPTERETVAEAFPEGSISREGTQNQIWALWKGNNKVMVETAMGIADGGTQEVGRLAPATLRLEGLRAAVKEENPEKVMAVNWTDTVRDNSANLAWGLGQGRGCSGDPSLNWRVFS